MVDLTTILLTEGDQKGDCQKGFTLMEVMVAISVVAIALMAIYRMHTQTLFMDSMGRFDTFATMLARQKLADVNSTKIADLIGDSGDFENDYPGYTWQVQSETVASDLIKEDGPVLKQITITILLNEDEAIYNLTTYRHGYE